MKKLFSGIVELFQKENLAYYFIKYWYIGLGCVKIIRCEAPTTLQNKIDIKKYHIFPTLLIFASNLVEK